MPNMTMPWPKKQRQTHEPILQRYGYWRQWAPFQLEPFPVACRDLWCGTVMTLYGTKMLGAGFMGYNQRCGRWSPGQAILLVSCRQCHSAICRRLSECGSADAGDKPDGNAILRSRLPYGQGYRCPVNWQLRFVAFGKEYL